MRRVRMVGWLLCVVAGFADARETARADDPAMPACFEQKIRPVLVKECYSCHSADAKKVKEGLRLDSKAGLLDGGDSGPALVPGKPAESLLLDALRHNGIDIPEGKLPEATAPPISSTGSRSRAPDPREGPIARKTTQAWISRRAAEF